MATDIGKVGIVPKGAWSNSATYEVLDVVSYNNGLYIAKQAVPAGTLPTNTTYWQNAINNDSLVYKAGDSISKESFWLPAYGSISSKTFTSILPLSKPITATNATVTIYAAAIVYGTTNSNILADVDSVTADITTCGLTLKVNMKNTYTVPVMDPIMLWQIDVSFS